MMIHNFRKIQREQEHNCKQSYAQKHFNIGVTLDTIVIVNSSAKVYWRSYWQINQFGTNSFHCLMGGTIDLGPDEVSFFVDVSFDKEDYLWDKNMN